MTSQSNSNSFVNAGELDPAFALEGIFNVPSGPGSIRSIIADGDDAFVLAAWVNKECWLYRVFSNGTQDLQFGQNGVAKWSFSPGLDSLPEQLLRQSDGKFLLIGKVGEDVFKRQTALTRFNRNGSPDLIFGNKIFSSADLMTSSICLQTDGKILVLPYGSGSSDERKVVLFRLQSNGETDLEFGNKGFIEFQFNDQSSQGVSMAVMDDGNIVVGGTVSGPSGSGEIAKAVARFLPDGVLDSSFGQSGCWESENSNKMQKMIVHENSIICVGLNMAGGYFACVSKVTQEGAYDPTFNNGQTVVVNIEADIPAFFVGCRAVVVQADGCIVAAGEAGNVERGFWLRLLPDGNPDAGFGRNGVFNYQQPSLVFELMAQTNDQRILAAVDLMSPERTPHVFGIQC
ncbi:NHL repeat-containing protein [Pseudomonas sp. LB3P93]